jgi:selenocysteine lyase/cysteine desulfurase
MEQFLQTMLTDNQIARLRSRFPILSAKTYLYSCSQGALSSDVEAGMAEYANSWRTSSAPWDEWMGKYEEIRASFARMIGAKAAEVAIVTSASAGINPIANSLDFSARKHVILSEYDFPTMGHIWLAQQQRGAQVEFVRGVEGVIPIERYRNAIDDRTAMVALTHVSFVNGSRSDVAAVTRLAHDNGALVFLDGYQDCGTRPIDVKALDVDFYVAGTLKYLLGPPGLAFLYVREGLAEKLNPPITSWMAQREVFAFNPQLLDPAPDARRFEGGSPPIPNIYAALPALKLLENIGLENVKAQVASLTRRFLKGAQALNLNIKTPLDSVGPLVVLRAHDAGAVVKLLAESNVLTSSRFDGVRFSFHVYNNNQDVDIALEFLKEHASLMVHEPASFASGPALHLG